MTPQRRNFYKNQLLALRRRLRGDVDRMTSDALAAGPASAKSNRMPIHPAEVAGDHFEQELAIALASSKDETLQKIEQALERIEDGVYGICDCCGRRIPQGRLDAIPYAGLCVGCARQNEEAVADLYGG